MQVAARTIETQHHYHSKLIPLVRVTGFVVSHKHNLSQSEDNPGGGLFAAWLEKKHI